MLGLTDDELRRKLKIYGVQSGPITPATRQVYERKLERLLNQDGQSKVTPIGRPSNRNTQPLKTPKLEGDTARNSVHPQHFPTPVQQEVDFDESHTAPSETRFRSSTFYSDEPFLNTRPSTQQQNPGHTPISNFRPSTNMPLTDISYNSPYPDLLHPQNFSTNGGTDSDNDQSCSTDERPLPDRFSFLGRRSNAAPSGLDANTSTTNSLLLTPRRDERNRSSFRFSWQPRATSATSGILSDDSRNGNVNTSRWSSRVDQSIRHSRDIDDHDFDNSLFSRLFGFSLGSQVPNLILLGGIILFAIIASSYVLLKDKHWNVGRVADLQKLVCQSTEHNSQNELLGRQPSCIKKTDLQGCMKIVHNLFEILSRLAGEYKCGEPLESPRMELTTAQRMLRASIVSDHQPAAQIDALWNSVVILIMEFGRKHFQIAPYTADGENPSSCDEIYELESLRPYIPGSCRLRLLFFSLLHFLYNLVCLSLIVLAVGGVCYLVFRVKQSHQRQANKRELRVREIVQQITSILQQQLQRRQAQPSEPPYVPVALIKDALSRSNKDLTDLWPDVESHVHLVEGCILVQEWRGVGETWQWHGGCGWQGSALIENSQRLPFTTPPTECLKVRNMFTRDSMNYEAQRRLKRELLWRIADCGSILHIGFDYQDNQGLVYIKCASPEVAGRVYEAIHANYFDSCLLTVKFLRASKYHLRFPEAHAPCQPLTVSDLD